MQVADVAIYNNGVCKQLSNATVREADVKRLCLTLFIRCDFNSDIVINRKNSHWCHFLTRLQKKIMSGGTSTISGSEGGAYVGALLQAMASQAGLWFRCMCNIRVGSTYSCNNRLLMQAWSFIERRCFNYHYFALHFIHLCISTLLFYQHKSQPSIVSTCLAK